MITAKEARALKGTTELRLETAIKMAALNGHSACKFIFKNPEEQEKYHQLLAQYGYKFDKHLIIWAEE